MHPITLNSRPQQNVTSLAKVVFHKWGVAVKGCLSRLSHFQIQLHWLGSKSTFGKRAEQISKTMSFISPNTWQHSPAALPPLSQQSLCYESSLTQLGAINFPPQSPHNLLPFLMKLKKKITAGILPVCSLVRVHCRNSHGLFTGSNENSCLSS